MYIGYICVYIYIHVCIHIIHIYTCMYTHNTYNIIHTSYIRILGKIAKQGTMSCQCDVFSLPIYICTPSVRLTTSQVLSKPPLHLQLRSTPATQNASGSINYYTDGTASLRLIIGGTVNTSYLSAT